MTLREAIEQAISLGHNDPVAIAEFVLRGHGEEIVLTEFDAKAYTADVARRVLGSQRRGAIARLARMDLATTREVMHSEVYLPGPGWVSLGTFTLAHWDTLTAMYRKGAATYSRYAEWCEANRALQAEEGVEFFRQVRGALPALPAPEAA